jgi:AcrR family transcriptional regulator
LGLMKGVTARRASRTTYHHGDLRAGLLVAAREKLEDEGLEALSLREIARRAGVSQAAPYHHFASKPDLLAAVAAEGFDQLAAAMQARVARAKTPAMRLNASGVGYVAFAAANPALFRLMFTSRGALPKDERLAAAAERARAVLLKALTEVLEAHGRDAADIPLARIATWSRAHGLAMLIIEGRISPGAFGFKNAEALATAMFAKTCTDDKLPF